MIGNLVPVVRGYCVLLRCWSTSADKHNTGGRGAAAGFQAYQRRHDRADGLL